MKLDRFSPNVLNNSSLWILPMRNWNQIRLGSYSCRWSALNTTYEELKPSFQGIDLFTPNPLNTTYEELKPKSGTAPRFAYVSFEYYLWGIETNKVKTFFAKPLYLWILPMRNWNVHRFRILQTDIISLNTTYEELKLLKISCTLRPNVPLWILPMRNWNCLWLHKKFNM